MMNKNHLSIKRVIGKIDNDFNIDNSDWIPRCAAWIIDGLSQMKCLPMEIKTKEVVVNDRIAALGCCIDDIKVFDVNGCEIKELTSRSCCGINLQSNSDIYIGVTQQNDDPALRTVAVKVASSNNRNFVISGGNKIELNFDTDKIIVKSKEVATYFDDYFNCDVPYIYDDGLLIEALTFYCMYKMLSRGYKHQVYSLTGSEPVNPYIQWIKIKDNARASVINSMRKNKDNEGWNNFFFNSTFLPRSN